MLLSAKLFSVLVFQTLCLCVIDTGRIKRVIGGKEVICGTQPRVASLRNATNNQHLCSATLLSADFAMTAAHCVQQHNADEIVLYLNNYCGEQNPNVQVLEVIANGLYDKYTRGHDIALLRISCDFDDTTWLTQSVLPESSFGLSGECTIYGYGFKSLEVKETSEVLLGGVVRIVSLEECRRRLGPYVAPPADGGMLCALGSGVDACQGDSGGPLLCSGVVHAVSSYGMSCGVPGLPGVYTSVGAHLQWIRDTIKNS